MKRPVRMAGLDKLDLGRLKSIGQGRDARFHLANFAASPTDRYHLVARECALALNSGEATMMRLGGL